MKKHKFVICTPPYANNSAGIIVLHELCDALVKNGHEAYVALMHMSEGQWDFHYPVSDEGFHPGLQRTVIDPVEYERAVNDALDNGICIYPEIVQGNPLMAKRVARYFLYYDGGITGEKCRYEQNDFLIAYSSVYLKNSHDILFKPAIHSSMGDQGAANFSSRRLDLTFVGKGEKFAKCFRLDGTVELSKSWPKEKVELAVLLRNTRYFYTWDCHSAVNIDAIFCGARPVIMQSRQLELDQVHLDADYMELLIPYSFTENGPNFVDSDGYEIKRSVFLARMNNHINSWPDSVNKMVSKMSWHFGI